MCVYVCVRVRVCAYMCACAIMKDGDISLETSLHSLFPSVFSVPPPPSPAAPSSPPQLAHQELLLVLLLLLQLLPRRVDIGHQFTLGWHVGGSAAQTELRLKSVEVGLQLCLLVHFRRLCGGVILAELLEAMLCVLQRLLRGTVSEPRHGALDPLKKLRKGRKGKGGEEGEGRGGEEGEGRGGEGEGEEM